MIYIGIILVTIITSLLIYKVIEFHNTEHKIDGEVAVVKNNLSTNWVGGTNSPFDNTNGNIEADKVIVVQVSKYKFGKCTNSYLEVKQLYAFDDLEE